MTRSQILKLAILCEGGAGVLALGVAWFFGQPFLGQLSLEPTLIVKGIVAAIPPLLGFLCLMRVNFAPFLRIREVLEREIRPLFSQSTMTDLCLISLLAGVGEELLFRGLVQGFLHEWVGPSLALFVASILFGAAHLITRTYALLATLIGLYLGCLMVWCGSLMVPVWTHAFYDFVALTYLMRIKRAPSC